MSHSPPPIKEKQSYKTVIRDLQAQQKALADSSSWIESIAEI